jgi:DNA-binding NarL/FixJ family response regulator
MSRFHPRHTPSPPRCTRTRRRAGLAFVVRGSHSGGGSLALNFESVVVIPAHAAAVEGAQPRLPDPLRVVVIDPQPLFVAALGSLLAAPPLRAEVLSAGRSDVGLEIVRHGGVHLVLCDVSVEPLSGRELAEVLGREMPSTPVILLAEPENRGMLAAALPSNAAGLFTKDAGLEEFLVGVEAVLSGHRAIGSSLMDTVLNRLAQVPAVQPGRLAGKLSPTELEILTMIGRAQSVQTIATSRGISSKTVRNHLARIYRKLELHGRTEAMLWAARAGLTNGRP